MLKELLISSALIFAPLTASAQMRADTALPAIPSGKYVSEASHTSLTFQIDHMGLSKYTARFTKVEADLDFNNEKPEASKLTAKIDPTSIRTDYPNAANKDFDKELGEGPEWFNAKKFPSITFESTKVTRTGDKTGKVTGNLTFLGVTKPITLDVTFNGGFAEKPFTKKPAIGFSARGVMKRSEWGFTQYLPTLGDDVTLIIETEFDKAE